MPSILPPVEGPAPAKAPKRGAQNTIAAVAVVAVLLVAGSADIGAAAVLVVNFAPKLKTMESVEGTGSKDIGIRTQQ